jgi:hypothetical protein
MRTDDAAGPLQSYYFSRASGSVTATTPLSFAIWLSRVRSVSQIPRSYASWASMAAVSSFFTCTCCSVGG